MTDGEVTADVAILGGGLVGPALALALARAGVSAAVVDPLAPATRADPGFDGRAYAVALGTARLLGALGLWTELEPKAEPIRDIVVGEGAGSPETLHFDPRATAEGRVGWILEDRHLRGALLAALAGAGVAHLAPARAQAIADVPGGVALTLEDGRRLRAKLLVGADGRRSMVARAAGIGRLSWRYRQTGLVAAIEHERPHEGVAHQAFFPGGPFATLPLPGNRCSIVWSETERRAEALMALDDRAYAEQLAARIGPRLGAVRLAGERRAFPLGLQLAERYVAPRRALVGDAAHGVHPIAGQGMNMGVRDVAALTEVLAEARRRGEDIGAVDVLGRYERWRRFDAAGFALGMDALNRLFSNEVPGLGPLRRLGLAVVDAAPPAKRALMREAAGTAGDVPKLMRGRAP
jgi:2-octaprenyl-6-methoxyphenol hydroxylase